MNPPLAEPTFSDGTPFSEGREYRFIIEDDTEYSGAILGYPGIVLWRYTTVPARSPWSPMNLVAKPDFVVNSANHNEALRVRRLTRFPSRFEMTENGAASGTITRQGLLRTQCLVQFGDEPPWTVHMPLFTIYFRAASTNGQEVLIRVGPSKRQWNLLATPGSDSLPLLSALAFLHREWWCC